MRQGCNIHGNANTLVLWIDGFAGSLVPRELPFGVSKCKRASLGKILLVRVMISLLWGCLDELFTVMELHNVGNRLFC